jgi:outer membrane protein TolC/ABC-type uncharacterized transport system substrate-binding protein
MSHSETGKENRNWSHSARIVVLLLASMAAPAAFGQDRPIVRVGIVFDGPVLIGIDVFEMIEKEVLDLTRREFDVRFPEDLRLDGGWEPASIRAAIDRHLQDPAVDIVLTIGAYGTSDVCLRGELPKPVVAANGVDATAQGFPFRFDDNGQRISGVRNLNYVAWSGIIGRDLRRFHQIVPFDTVHIIFDPLALEFIPGLYDFVLEEIGDADFKFEPVTGISSAADVLEALPADTEAVYFLPLVRMSPEERSNLIAGFIEKKIPTFSLLGVSDVERGILAGTSPKGDNIRKARRIALNVQRILLGDDAGTLPVDIERAEKLTINMATARAIDYYPTWRILTRAVLLNEEEEATGRVLSLSDAVHTAVAANMDLQAFGRFVAAGEETIHEAKSGYRPQLDVSAGARQIDADRATLGFGLNAEELATGSLTLSQLIYSDKVLADIDISKDVQDSRVYENETLMLDIALQASVAYLDLLRAGTLERILKNNLRLTETNLGIARRRLEIGVANPSEVFRWESALATDRSDLIASQRLIDINRTTLNQVLNQPQEQRFVAEDPRLDDPALITSNDQLMGLVDNPWGFEKFRDFMVGDGLARSPELQALDAAIAAEQRTLTAARRTFYAPDVSFFGGIEQQFHRGGAGSDPAIPIPGFEVPDRTNWVLGVEAILPLYAGGQRSARAGQSQETLSGFQFDRVATAQRVELRIRNSLYRASASFNNIELSGEAAAAANKNLELVTNQYRQGLVSIIELIDAQNAALVADQNAANAVYDFLIDLMEVQRATNNFDFFSSEAERDAWFNRVKQFIEESKQKE